MISLKKDEKLKDVKFQVKMFTSPGDDSTVPPEKGEKVWKMLKESQSGQ